MSVVTPLPLAPAADTMADEVAEHIIRERCGRALGRDVEAALEAYTFGELSIWVSPERGFLLLQTIEYDGGPRALFVRAIEGRDLYSPAGVEALRILAIRERCERIEAVATREAVRRQLVRLGFKFVGTRDGKYQFERYVNGRQ